MTFPVLQTDSLTKRYRGVSVVDRLSLTVERGDIYGFLGRNGAGKSTTIRMALGLVRPSSGGVRLLGYDIAKHRSKALAKVGAIIEAPAFYENFSGLQNLQMLAALSGGASARRIEEVIEIVGLNGRARDPVRVYSHGMRQRLGIAQALLPDPKFIILDEPTDGLDPHGILEMRLLIRRLHHDLGLTVMLSSHLLYEVEQICNRIAIIEGGELVYQGSLSELITGETTYRLMVDRVEEVIALLERAHPDLNLSRNGDKSLYVTTVPDRISTINTFLVANGFQVSELSPQRESLEQVFFRLTEKRQAK
jgi:ABC-type multidrug transport system ATPase subunit